MNGYSVLIPLLTTLFVGLKLGGVINWAWLWVLSPLWMGLVVALILTGLFFIVYGMKR
jgi:hypothetical protein